MVFVGTAATPNTCRAEMVDARSASSGRKKIQTEKAAAFASDSTVASKKARTARTTKKVAPRDNSALAALDRWYVVRHAPAQTHDFDHFAGHTVPGQRRGSTR